MPKSNAEINREYRKRKSLIPKTENEKLQNAKRQAEFRKRNNIDQMKSPESQKRLKLQNTIRQAEFRKRRKMDNEKTESDLDLIFDEFFNQNPFGYVCDACDRMWCKKDFKKIPSKSIPILQPKFPDQDISSFQLCNTCWNASNTKKISLFCKFKCINRNCPIQPSIMISSTIRNVNRDYLTKEFIQENSRYMVKKDDFNKTLQTMIGFLGKPTLSLTLYWSAENQSNLKNVLQKLYGKLNENVFEMDPVISMIEFKRMVDAIIHVLEKGLVFETYRMKDYLTCFQFEKNNNLPYAQMILWLDKIPFNISPKVIDSLYTCSSSNTFQTRNRNIYWPMDETRLLDPINNPDHAQKYNLLYENLKTMKYDSLQDFLNRNDVDLDLYLEIIQSSLSCQTIFLKREMNEIYIDAYHPWIASKIQSNMNIEYILNDISIKQNGSSAVWFLLKYPRIQKSREIILLAYWKRDLVKRYIARSEDLENMNIVDFISKYQKNGTLRKRECILEYGLMNKEEDIFLHQAFRSPSKINYSSLVQRREPRPQNSIECRPQKLIDNNGKPRGSLPIDQPRKSLLPDDEFDRRIAQATTEQRTFLADYKHRIIRKKEELYAFITGAAGTGKTFLLDLLIDVCNRYGRSRGNYNSVLVVTPTGISAIALNALTIHAAFQIGAKTKISSLSSINYTLFCHILKDIDTIIIDELSMVSPDLINIINIRLQNAKQCTKVFGGVYVIFSGDLRQLPPVKQRSVYQLLKGDCDIWTKMQPYELTKVLRQDDDFLIRVLTNIGMGKKLTRNDLDYIHTFANRQPPDDAIRLFRSRADVATYNAKVLQNPIIHQAKDKNYDGQDDIEGLKYQIRLVLEKPYMLTHNIDLNHGLANGLIGTLQQIYRRTDGEIIKLGLQFPKTTELTEIKIKILSDEYGRERAQFPLIEANAVTIHKTIGAGYDNLVYEYDKSHPTAMVYTAMSRVKSANGLYLTHKSGGDFKFHHGEGSTYNEINQVMERRLESKYDTVGDRMQAFLKAESDLTLYVHKIDNLRGKPSQIMKDVAIPMCRYFCLTGTGLDSHDDVDIIDTYRCVSKNCWSEGYGGVVIYEKDDGKSLSKPFLFPETKNKRADLCGVTLMVNGRETLLAAVDFYDKTDDPDVLNFLSEKFSNINIPIILFVSFTRDMKYHTDLIRQITCEMSFSLLSDLREITTTSNTVQDLIFARQAEDVELEYYVTFYSRHEPILVRVLKNQMSQE